MGFGLLSVAIWLPIAVGVLLLAMGRDDNPGAARWLALVGALAAFLVTLPLIGGFDQASAALQFQENLPWRSEERRVGKECAILCRSRWSPYH